MNFFTLSYVWSVVRFLNSKIKEFHTIFHTFAIRRKGIFSLGYWSTEPERHSPRTGVGTHSLMPFLTLSMSWPEDRLLPFLRAPCSDWMCLPSTRSSCSLLPAPMFLLLLRALCGECSPLWQALGMKKKQFTGISAEAFRHFLHRMMSWVCLSGDLEPK